MSPTIATLRSLSADLYPLPDRLRLIAQPPLTACPASGNLNFPNNHRRHRRLCRAPHGEKSGCFYSCRPASIRDACAYWQGDVRVSARPRRL